MILLKIKFQILSAGSVDIIENNNHLIGGPFMWQKAPTIKHKVENFVSKKKKEAVVVPTAKKKKEAPEISPASKEVDSPVHVVEEPINLVQFSIAEEPVNPAAVFKKEDIVEINDEAVVELIPKFAEAEIKRSKEENNAEHTQIQIKKLRKKMEDGSISDGEAAELFNLLSEQ